MCYLNKIFTQQMYTFPRSDVKLLNVSLQSVRDSIQRHEEELYGNETRLKNDRNRWILKVWLEPV
jgi:predicted DNA-binding protein YlxM (UPF0122 family)